MKQKQRTKAIKQKQRTKHNLTKPAKIKQAV